MSSIISVSVPSNNIRMIEEAKIFLGNCEVIARQDEMYPTASIHMDEGGLSVASPITGTQEDVPPVDLTQMAVMTQGAAAPAVAPAAAPVIAAPTIVGIDQNLDIDAEGFPHDPRIHRDTGNKTKKAPFTWIKRRSTKAQPNTPAQIKSVQDEWIANGYGPSRLDPAQQAPASVAPAAAPAVAPVAAPVPTSAPAAAQLRPATPQERMTDKAFDAKANKAVPYETFINSGNWTDQMLMDNEYMRPPFNVPVTAAAAPAAVTVAAPVAVNLMTYPELFSTVISPNVESGLLNYEEIDDMVSEVTDGAIEDLSLMAQPQFAVLVPELARRLTEYMTAANG